MRDPRDSVDMNTAGEAGADRTGGQNGRPFLQLWFTCSGKYTRAYRNAAGTGYLGRCPSCGKSVRFRVGEGGTSERFFEISC